MPLPKRYGSLTLAGSQCITRARSAKSIVVRCDSCTTAYLTPTNHFPIFSPLSAFPIGIVPYVLLCHVSHSPKVTKYDAPISDQAICDYFHAHGTWLDLSKRLALWYTGSPSINHLDYRCDLTWDRQCGFKQRLSLLDQLIDRPTPDDCSER
jgi:hypothetical protein